MIAFLAAVAFVVCVYALASWLLVYSERPRRRRWTHGRRS